MSSLDVTATRGFTVVELVTVILLLSILSIGTVRFINDAAAGFQTASERAELAAGVRQTVQQLSTALREALPNSVRVSASGDCIEYVPVLNASAYESAPIGLAGTGMRVVPFDAAMPGGAWRVAVAPTNALYGLSNPGAISPVASVAAADADNLLPVTFVAAHEFAAASPRRRAFIVDGPVSLCGAAGALYRYQNYGYNAAQPGVALLPTGLPDRQILLGDIGTALPIFAATSATLTRNAIVEIYIDLQRGDEALSLHQTVQLRNQL